MGKRELLLVAAFVLVGFVLYQFTAAPAAPNPNAVSGRSIIDHLRREVRGNRASAELERTLTHAVDPSVNELRLRLQTGPVTVTGEDRADVEIHMKVWSNGYDDAEAKALAKESVDALKIDPAGGLLVASVAFPRPGTQRPTFTIKVPSRLRIRAEMRGTIGVANVAAVDLGDSGGGKSSVSNVPGTVTGTHRGGELVIDHVGSVRMTAQGSQITVTGTKDLTVNMRGGELRAENVAGVMEIESNNADLRLDRLAPTMSSLRVNARGGTIRVNGLRADTRIDSRNTDVQVAMDRAAPLAVYGEGNSDIDLTLPASGFTLDAVARDGRITPPDVIKQLGLSLEEHADSKEARVSGGGGGAAITLRTNGGDIVLRGADSTKK